MLVELSKPEIDLLVEALRKAASRHESEARYNPPAAKPHDVKARGMNALRVRLTKAIAQSLAVAAVTLIIAAAIAPAIALSLPTSAARNFTPTSNVRTAGCVAYQVCQTCYRPDGTAYTCNCHMECLPGIH